MAVEDSLTPVWEELEEEGFEPVPLDDADGEDVFAVVLSGQDDDFLGDEAIQVDVPVIVAEGMTPTEVIRRLRHIEDEG